ncbi:MAG: DUF2807 domain-containing protein [Myxococcales bacterium]|nr:DUF2807 domain-containing protein [Myxococcales bacterium]
MKHVGFNLGLAIVCIVAALGGCAPEDGPLVGSDVRDDELYMVGAVEDVKVSLPFHVRMHDGEPGEVRIEGEDNLIGFIAVEDFGDGRIEISTADNFGQVEQNQPIDIYLPYAEMTRIEMDGTDIMMWDDPRYM